MVVSVWLTNGNNQWFYNLNTRDFDNMALIIKIMSMKMQMVHDNFQIQVQAF
jgi:hypothetical protein